MSERADRIEARLAELEIRIDALEAKAPKSLAFRPPDPVQVYEYFADHGASRLMADDFFDFYACKGWMVGKTKMTDWERAAARWIRSNMPAPAAAVVVDSKPADVRARALEERAQMIITEKRRQFETAVAMPDDLRRPPVH